MKNIRIRKGFLSFLFGGILICGDFYACNSKGVAVVDPEPKYIIFMVPDGMGLSNVTAARIYKNGPDGVPLHLETLPHIGYQRTHSRDCTVTDSAAAASAWASGEKFNNREISCRDEDRDSNCDGTRKNPMTILEKAKDKGLSTGLVVTSTITHATPAAFGAHVHHRKCESEIFSQYLDHDIDILFGADIGTNKKECILPATDAAHNETLLQKAIADGYTYVTTKTELDHVDLQTTRLIGLFSRGNKWMDKEGMTPMFLRSAKSSEPTLSDMTRAALKILEKGRRGFFLLVEGSQIDWANHFRHPMYQIRETLAFDNAVEAVWNWVNADDERKRNALLIVVADHECGGVIIDGPTDRLSGAGDTNIQSTDIRGNPLVDHDGKSVMTPDLTIRFGSNPKDPTGDAKHTAVDTIIWSNNPACAKALDNTDLYQIMADFLN